MTLPVTYLSPYPATSHNALVWGFERMSLRGFDVCHFDVSDLLGSSARAAGSGSRTAVSRHLNWPSYAPNSIVEFEQLVSQRSSGPIVDFIVGLGWVSQREAAVFAALKRCDASLVAVSGGTVPVFGGMSASGSRHLLRRAVNPRAWANLVAKRLIERERAAGSTYALPSIVFAGASPVRDTFLARYSALGKAVVPVNSFDFDRYIDWKEAGGSAEPDGTLLFIDEGLTHHPDWAYLDVEPLSAEPYFRSLRRFFDRIEAQTGLTVRIAGHPKVDYEALGDVFDGRELVLGRTLDAVAVSAGVLATATTAVSFATIFEKPVLIIVTEQMNRTGYVVRARETASALGALLLNVDDDDAVSLQSLEPSRWPTAGLAGYRDTYVVDPKAPSRNTWEIVADHLGEERGA